MCHINAVVCTGSWRQQRTKIDDSQLDRTRRKSMENMELVKLTPDKVKFLFFMQCVSLFQITNDTECLVTVLQSDGCLGRAWEPVSIVNRDKNCTKLDCCSNYVS